MATEAQCKQALDFFEDELSHRQNVIGLGIVPADEESSSGRGEMAVGVYVVKKLPSSRLSARDVVPQTLRLPSKRGIVEVPTRVIEQGKVRIETPAEMIRFGPASLISNRRTLSTKLYPVERQSGRSPMSGEWFYMKGAEKMSSPSFWKDGVDVPTDKRQGDSYR